MPAPDSVSILIAAHNRCELLAQTLESLARLTIPAGVPVECIVVANACTDDTEGVVGRAAASGALPFPLRAVAEPRRGVSFARNRAVEESRHALCLFIDSDCLAEPGWLVEHLRMYREHGAGLVTGRIDLWWERAHPPNPPTALTRSMREALGEHHFADSPQRLAEPRAYAANFSFTREVFARAGPFRTDIGRAGTGQTGGRLAHEETVFARRAMALGHSFWWTPSAVVRHWAPADSLTDRFFTRSAYWGSVSYMMTVEPFGPAEALGAMIKSPARAVISAARLAAARFGGSEPAASAARMDTAGALGRLRGLWTRVTGLNTPRP